MPKTVGEKLKFQHKQIKTKRPGTKTSILKEVQIKKRQAFA